MKGLSTPLKIIVVMIVLLIAALIVIMIFSGGMTNVQAQFNNLFDWLNGQELPECTTTLQCDEGNICSNGKCISGVAGGSSPLDGFTRQPVGGPCTTPSDCQMGLTCTQNKCTAG